MQGLAGQIAGLPGAAVFDADMVARAATAFVSYAEAQGFTLGRGVAAFAPLQADR